MIMKKGQPGKGSKVVLLHRYRAYSLSWGKAIWDREEKRWEAVLFPDGQQLDCSRMQVAIFEQGIKIISPCRHFQRDPEAPEK